MSPQHRCPAPAWQHRLCGPRLVPEHFPPQETSDRERSKGGRRLWGGWGAGKAWDGQECGLSDADWECLWLRGTPTPWDCSCVRPGAVTGWERDILNPALGSLRQERVSYKLGLCSMSDWGWLQIRRCGAPVRILRGALENTPPKKAPWTPHGVCREDLSRQSQFHRCFHETRHPPCTIHRRGQARRKAEALLPSGGSRRHGTAGRGQSGCRGAGSPKPPGSPSTSRLRYLHRLCPVQRARREEKGDPACPCGGKRAAALPFLWQKPKARRGRGAA